MPREKVEEGDCREGTQSVPATHSPHRIEELIGAIVADQADLDGERRDALEMRLYFGYYDLPDVRQKVADRLAASTASGTPGCCGDKCKKKGRSPGEPS